MLRRSLQIPVETLVSHVMHFHSTCLNYYLFLSRQKVRREPMSSLLRTGNSSEHCYISHSAHVQGERHKIIQADVHRIDENNIE